jgi:hypothetical protein
MNKIVRDKLDLMKIDKGYWSMDEVCMEMIEEYGHEAGALARTYILEEVCNIPDEQKYIEKNIQEARKQKLNIKLFDKDVEQVSKERV